MSDKDKERDRAQLDAAMKAQWRAEGGLEESGGWRGDWRRLLPGYTLTLEREASMSRGEDHRGVHGDFKLPALTKQLAFCWAETD